MTILHGVVEAREGDDRRTAMQKAVDELTSAEYDRRRADTRESNARIAIEKAALALAPAIRQLYKDFHGDEPLVGGHWDTFLRTSLAWHGLPPSFPIASEDFLAEDGEAGK